MSAYKGMAGKLTLDQRQTALVLYNQGWGFARIAKHLNVTRQAIHYLVRTRLTAPASWTTRDRNEAGINVTLRRQDTRELHSLHIPGKRMEALQHLADLIDHSGIDWRLLSYSTPQTIGGDLAKKRIQQAETGSDRDMPTYLSSIEANMLGRIRRLDLLDPQIDLGQQRGQVGRK